LVQVLGAYSYGVVADLHRLPEHQMNNDKLARPLASMVHSLEAYLPQMQSDIAQF
jgi:hypothetical protein